MKKHLLIITTLFLIIGCGSIAKVPAPYEVYINNSKIGNTPATYTLESNTNYNIEYKQNNNMVFSKELNLAKKRTVTFKVINGKTLYTDIITGETVYF